MTDQTDFVPFISRAMIDADEAKDLLNLASRMVDSQASHGQKYFSPVEVLEYAATALRAFFFEVATDHLEDVEVTAIN